MVGLWFAVFAVVFVLLLLICWIDGLLVFRFCSVCVDLDSCVIVVGVVVVVWCVGCVVWLCFVDVRCVVACCGAVFLYCGC